MRHTETQHALQDAMNLLERLLDQCTNLEGWGHLYNAQRYLKNPQGYEFEVRRQNFKCGKITSTELQLF